MINNIMKRLSELPNITMDDGQEYIQLYDAMETVKRALEQEPTDDATLKDIFCMGCEYKEQEPCDDCISRQAVLDLLEDTNNGWIINEVLELPPIKPQEPKTDKYEYHTDHTDCIWYGNDSGCPVTCSQYRDGWNDAMDYIFKNGNGYQPYRHDS